MLIRSWHQTNLSPPLHQMKERQLFLEIQKKFQELHQKDVLLSDIFHILFHLHYILMYVPHRPKHAGGK